MKLKICGVMTVEEAEELKKAGVDYIGLNFVTESPRCISLEQAENIMSVLKGSPVQTVALFRDEPVGTVNDYAKQLGVDYVQLHGSEDIDYAKAIHFPVIKAIAVDPNVTASELIDYIKQYPAEYFVLDRHEQGRGDIVSTGLAREIAEAIPAKICLAGGLTPDNLAEILSQVRPYAVDIASGVRTSGAIDMNKIQACLDIIRSGSSSRS